MYLLSNVMHPVTICHVGITLLPLVTKLLLEYSPKFLSSHDHLKKSAVTPEPRNTVHIAHTTHHSVQMQECLLALVKENLQRNNKSIFTLITRKNFAHS